MTTKWTSLDRPRLMSKSEEDRYSAALETVRKLRAQLESLDERYSRGKLTSLEHATKYRAIAAKLKAANVKAAGLDPWLKRLPKKRVSGVRAAYRGASSRKPGFCSVCRGRHVKGHRK